MAETSQLIGVVLIQCGRATRDPHQPIIVSIILEMTLASYDRKETPSLTVTVFENSALMYTRNTIVNF